MIAGWTPSERVAELRLELERAAGGQLVLDELSTPSEVEPPVLMRNRKLARPFEFLVRFLDLPRSGSLDPTVLMALFLPLMVGVMVGDLVYGTLLLVIALFVRRRFAARFGGGSRSEPRVRCRCACGRSSSAFSSARRSETSAISSGCLRSGSTEAVRMP